MLYGYSDQLLQGAFVTLQLACIIFPIGLVLGFLGALAKQSRSRFVRSLAEYYTTIIRGVPELLILLLFYYGGGMLTQHLAGVELNAWTAGIIALSLIFGGYATEIFRGALLAIQAGQIEAAKAVGMGWWLTTRRVTFPLMFRYALPSLGNLWLVLLKDTSLISIIGVNELMRKSYVAAGATRDPLTFYCAAGVLYLFFTTVSLVIIRYLEKKTLKGAQSKGRAAYGF